MPDKTYVFVAAIAVKEAFDNKYKSSLPKRIADAIGDAIDRSPKLTTKPPKDKKAEGFYVAGDFWLRKTDKGIEAELKTVLAEWPRKKMFGSRAARRAPRCPTPPR